MLFWTEGDNEIILRIIRWLRYKLNSYREKIRELKAEKEKESAKLNHDNLKIFELDFEIKILKKSFYKYKWILLRGKSHITQVNQ